MNLYTLLSSLPTLNAVIGPRAYPMLLADGVVMPALTFQVVHASPRARDMNGSYLTDMTVIFRCFGKDYDSADAVRSSLIADLDNFQGLVGDQNLQEAVFTDTSDDYLDQVNLFAHSVKFSLTF